MIKYFPKKERDNYDLNFAICHKNGIWAVIENDVIKKY